MVYQGSKTKYAKEIVPILQKYIDDNGITVFIDGMCGGCNIIDKIKCETRNAIDINEYLIALYEYAVIWGDGQYPETITREMWDSCKNHPEDNHKWLVGLVEFFASYSARGFVGGYALNGTRDYYTERLNNFKKQIPNLQGINFCCSDINNVYSTDALFYLDPPYKNTKKYGVSKNFDYDKFWNKVRDLSKDNIVIVSEQEAPDDFEIIWEKDVKRNCFGSGTKSAKERLFKLK